MLNRPLAHIPAPDRYFDECVKVATSTGALRFLGGASIDSIHHAVRRTIMMLPGNDVTNVALVRITTLFFSIPGMALLLHPRYVETIDRSPSRRSHPKEFELEMSAYWEFRMHVGMLAGLGWTDSFPYVSCKLSADGKQFCEGSHSANGVSGPVQLEPLLTDLRFERIQFPDDFDGKDEGCFTSPELFGTVTGNLLHILEGHVRNGGLGHPSTPTSISVSGFPPWQEFRGCEDDFFRQCPREALAPAYVTTPIREKNDTGHHNSLCGY